MLQSNAYGHLGEKGGHPTEGVSPQGIARGCPPRCFLKPRQRLRRGRDFAALREQGRRFATPGFVVYGLLGLTPDTACSPRGSRALGAAAVHRATFPCLGVVASRRVGDAVKRNLGKRWTREAFRRAQHSLPCGSRVMVVLRAGFDTLSFAAFEAQLVRACQRVLKTPPQPGRGETPRQPEPGA